MIRLAPGKFVLSAASAAVLLALAPAASLALDDPPRPRVDCTKKANKNNPACKNHRDDGNDEIYNAAYVLAHAGRYGEARALLLTARADDPRILTYLGFTTRKLGDVDGALRYYDQAIALKPSDTRARSYRGEAYLQKGDVASARVELGEIAARCGTTCEEHAVLAREIAVAEAARG